MDRLTWSGGLDALLLRLRAEHPRASAAELAKLLSAEGVATTRKAVHHRLVRLGAPSVPAGPPDPVDLKLRELLMAAGDERRAELESVKVQPIRYRDAVPVTREDDDRVVFVFGDAQYPYCSMATHEALVGLLDGERPDALVLNGDMVDLPSLSAHRPRPELLLEGGLNAELAFAYARLHELVEAAGPQCRSVLLEGNHELRARTMLIDRASALYGVRPRGDLGAAPVFGMESLLGLEHLGIEYVEGYPHATVMLAPDLAVTHGSKSRTGAGQTVRAYLDQFPGVSYIVGHVHRLAVISRAMQTPFGLAGTQWGAESGTLSALSGHEMGYLEGPNWTPGGIAVSFSGDSWSLEPVTGRLLEDGRVELAWRGRRYVSRSTDRAAVTAPVLRLGRAA